MKTFTLIAKIVAALAAVAGIVYVVATYGDKIVAWAKKLLGKSCCNDCCEDCACADCDCNEEGVCVCEGECEDCECSDCEGGDCETCCCDATCEEVTEAEVAPEAAEKDFEA